MPKRKGSKKSRNSRVLIGGGDIITQSSCGAQLDTSRYTAPCKSNLASLPLDPGFGGGNIVSKNFGVMSGGGGCAMCEGNPVMSGGGCGSMSGGGLTVAVDRPQIAGQPEYVSYSDNSPPVFLKNQTVLSQDGQPLCGQKGGKNKKRKTRRRVARTNKLSKKKVGGKRKRYNRKNKNSRKNRRRKTRNRRRN